MKNVKKDAQLTDIPELMRSLQRTIKEVRRRAENLAGNMQSMDDAAIGYVSKEVSSLEGLIRTCQKVEASLVEVYLKRTREESANALDLDASRSEIEGRLSRLREQFGEDQVS